VSGALIGMQERTPTRLAKHSPPPHPRGERVYAVTFGHHLHVLSTVRERRESGNRAWPPARFESSTLYCSIVLGSVLRFDAESRFFGGLALRSAHLPHHFSINSRSRPSTRHGWKSHEARRDGVCRPAPHQVANQRTEPFADAFEPVAARSE